MANHLALPLTITTAGQLAAVPQDSPADVAQSLALLLSTRPGERRVAPAYGLDDPRGGGVDAELVAAVIESWEPRAVVDVELTDAGPVVQTVQIRSQEVQ